MKWHIPFLINIHLMPRRGKPIKHRNQHFSHNKRNSSFGVNASHAAHQQRRDEFSIRTVRACENAGHCGGRIVERDAPYRDSQRVDVVLCILALDGAARLGLLQQIKKGLACGAYKSTESFTSLCKCKLRSKYRPAFSTAKGSRLRPPKYWTDPCCVWRTCARPAVRSATRA
jgi:hypothetical protein